MTNKEGYNYEEFLSDSSDDSPKYDEGIKQEDVVEKIADDDFEDFLVQSGAYRIKQADDDMNYQQAYSQDEVAYALSKVLDESSAEHQYLKVVKQFLIIHK